jgi:hypothetical protein
MKLILPFLLFLVLNTNAQNDYKSIQNSDLYLKASATSSTAEEAQTFARNMLIKQISSVVSSSSTMTITAGNTTSEQKFDNVSKSTTTLHLEGLKFVNIPMPKNEQGFTFLAYISKEDLKKSSESAANLVRIYLDLMEQQNFIGINPIASVYSAYLASYLTPYPIGYTFGSDSIANVQPYLASMLSNYLSKISITCSLVEEHPHYPKEQLRFNLNLNGDIAENLQYTFTCPSYNALCEFGLSKVGVFDVMMRPNAPQERMKGILNIKASVDNILLDLSKSLPIEQGKEFEADMKKIIQFDFEVKEFEKYVQLIPTIKNLSINSFEWSSNGKVFSSEQQPKISKSDLGDTICLKLNSNEALKRVKSFNFAKTIIEVQKPNEVAAPVVEKAIIEKTIVEKSNNKLEVKAPTSSYTKESYGFENIKNFGQLNTKLKQLELDGKIAIGSKSDFIKPQNCWVFIIDPISEQVTHILSPEENGRSNLFDQTKYINFEQNFKGASVLWVSFY